MVARNNHLYIYVKQHISDAAERKRTNQNLSYEKLHKANVPISKDLTPYAEKFDSLLNLLTGIKPSTPIFL